ncbi:MAG: hypothetical protein JO065_13885 [Acidobacteria bacterium]|nr:hypothetical protein [Acidobacteriota bacterium]
MDAETVLHHLDELQPKFAVSAADFELQTGNAGKAVSLYQAAGARNVTTPGAHSDANKNPSIGPRIVEANLAEAANDPQSIAGARQSVEKLESTTAKSNHQLLASEVALVSDDLITAEREAKAAIPNLTNAAPAHYLLGEVAARRGESAAAWEHWLTAQQLDPHYVPARLALSAAALEQQNAKETEEQIVPVVRDEPANVRALLIYARALLLEHRYDSAQALCRRAEALAAKKSEIAIVEGDIALEQRQFAQALVQYEKAILLDPYSEEAMGRLTDVYQRGGADGALVHKLERLALSGTPSSRMMEIAGRLYARRHENANAVRCLRRAIQMDPQRSSARIALATLYDESDGNKAFALIANPEWGIQKLGSSTVAAASDSKTDKNSLERQYEETIRAGDPSGIASNNLAWIYASEGRNLERALELAKHARDKNPRSPEVLDTLGMVEFERREFSDAVTCFRRAIRQASTQKLPDIQHQIEAHLAAALHETGADSIQ